MNNTLEIKKELTKETYSTLIDFGLNNCTSFPLVWRYKLDFDENAKSIEQNLKDHLIKEEYTNEWPGTKIIGSKAKVRFYKFNSGTVTILKKISSLYKWISPSAPEDLAFYLKDDLCLLESISHEELSLIYIYEDTFSLEKLEQEIP
ncbi:MAG: hypothetical protein ABH952_00010 [Candidatus Omnitrophota bacterium]